MPLTKQRQQELALMMLPTNDAMQQRVRKFLLQSGLNQSEFAQAIGFSHVAVSHFLNGRYGAHHASPMDVAANLKAACKTFIDLHEVNQDVRLRGEHFATEDFLEVRNAAHKALRDGLAYIVDGPPGTQKSWSLLNVQRELTEAGAGRVIYVYARVEHTKQSFLQEVCRAAGVPNGGSVDKLLHKLQFFLAKGKTLLLVDEAQHLSHSGLEVLRQLLDLPPYFGVMLAGSHDLAHTLQDWQMEQWRRRVQARIELRGPKRSEAREILAGQLGVTDKAEADAIIADCMAQATKHDGTRRRSYEYISAGLLFGFIQGAKAELTPEEVAA